MLTGLLQSHHISLLDSVDDVDCVISVDMLLCCCLLLASGIDLQRNSEFITAASSSNLMVVYKLYFFTYVCLQL